MGDGPMLNAYPDSMGGTLGDIVSILEKEDFKDVFQSFYILPSIFHSDLDRGFSVIDYGINESLAKPEDLAHLKELGIELKLDFILNHASVNSPQFQDLLARGDASEYKDFFIDWNRFWEGHGQMTGEGYIQPDAELIKDMFFRKPGLPILMVKLPDGRRVPYWNTFYQEVFTQRQEDGTEKECYLGQMDLNIKCDKVWKFYTDTLDKLSGYGAKIVRLDAFAYAPKEVGKKNFLNEPETWELLNKIDGLASERNLSLLPEIHAGYGEKIYELVAQKGYMTYDFFLPGLLLYAIEKKDGDVLVRWAKELVEKKIRVVNMLGCHDGIPLLDLKGFLPDEEIGELIDTLVQRGGFVKNLHGKKNMYYQVNATYFSALGEDEQKLLFARALQMFMPGKPQVWYLDLFAGKNDHEAVARAGAGGHKEINRTNLTIGQMEAGLETSVVKKQLELLRFRNTCPAFGFDARLEITTEGSVVYFQWSKEGASASLTADFATYQFAMSLS